ncbi:hypothetical protein SAMN05192563_10518 [Paraburkholderia aspalathi]|uniref:Uncharacterized protein n=1 Tax=Paraburkholderia aspalathi TaxID=1324617 RepID=A0A1I7EQV4_9BURK|nr:hypothetical protein SAMN05192563_10518 [Paraburkholderia aspalathi]
MLCLAWVMRADGVHQQVMFAIGVVTKSHLTIATELNCQP